MIIFLNKFISTFIGMLVMFLLSKKAGSETLGQYTLMVSFFYLLSAVGVGGNVNLLLMEYISGKKEDRGKLINFVVQRAFIMTVVAVLCSSILYYFYDDIFSNWLIISLFFLIFVVKILLDIFSAFLRCNGFDVVGGMLDSLLRPALFLILLTLLGVYGGISLLNITLVLAVSFVCTLFFGAGPFLFSICRKEKFDLAGIYQPKKRKNLHRHANSFMVITFSQIASRHSDIMLIGATLGASSVAIYAVGAKIAAVGSFILLAATSIIAPRIASLKDSGQEVLNHELYKNNQFSSVIGLITIVFILLLAQPFIIYAFGDEYLPAVYIVYILCVVEYAIVLLGDSSIVMNMLGMGKKNAEWLVYSIIIQSVCIIVLSALGNIYIMVLAIGAVRCIYKLLLLLHLRSLGIYVSCLDPQNRCK